MGSRGIFGETFSILEKNLDLRSLRHNLIISNIANRDTPHYKAFDVAVDEEMKKLDGLNREVVRMVKTRKNHLGPPGTAGESPEIVQTSDFSTFEQNADGNTVNVEKEMTKLAENNLLYETMAQIIRKKFQDLKIAIQGGGR
ncbi:MAG: flagellar basal body rod protein FlgB [Deltaproteobacteria bacterium]|nr:MAG: flagellar basal body rod protein FlgB [Deltaproteobacteria bacterium]